MTDLYRVDVYKTLETHFIVAAPTFDDAKFDADILADDIDDWDFVTQDIDVSLGTVPPAGNEQVWSGGSEGSWVYASDLEDVTS